MVNNQTDESKFIKRINEQLAQISRQDTGILITRWSRAIRESGVDFTVENGRYKIRNTKSNREKIDNLITTMQRYNPQTIGQFHKQIRAELRVEAEKNAPEKLTAKQREKYIRKYTSKSAVKKRALQYVQNADISSRLDVIYQMSPQIGAELGIQLSNLTRGKRRADVDTRHFYDVTGQITAEYQRIIAGELTEQEQYAARVRTEILNDYAYDIGGETNDTVGKNQQSKRKNRAKSDSKCRARKK